LREQNLGDAPLKSKFSQFVKHYSLLKRKIFIFIHVYVRYYVSLKMASQTTYQDLILDELRGKEIR